MKAFLSDVRIGLKALSSAYAFMRIHKLRHYFLYPLILSILFWVIGLQLIEQWVDVVSEYIHGRWDLGLGSVRGNPEQSFIAEAWESIKAFYNDGYTVVLSFIIRIVMWILLILVGKYVMLALLSPVLALLSERSEEIITGRNYPFNLKQFLMDILRGVLVAMRNLVAELLMLSVLWICTLLLPVLAPVNAIIAFGISAFYYGFSMLDYVSERQRLSLSESFRKIRSRRGLSIALGVGVGIGLLVPVVGFIIASFTSIVSVVAAVNVSYAEPLNYQSEIKVID